MSQPLLAVDDLAVSFQTEQGRLTAIDGVHFQLRKGEVLGIVGESGCGKSVTAMSLMRLLPRPSAVIERGSILFNNTDITALPKSELFKVRGNKMAMIFQEPMTALNPVYTIGRQMTEIFNLHFPELGLKKAMVKCQSLLEEVGIPEALKRLGEYPHQLSGGMRQRVMIAMALACEPDLLIADEPTTALDVTTQAQILDLMLRLRQDKGMGIILITHDLGVIAEACDDVLVMYAGRGVERASIQNLFQSPRHPYSQGLLASMPSLAKQRKSRLPTIDGMVPPLTNMPKGCRFADRCHLADDTCRSAPPEKTHIDGHSWVHCYKAPIVKGEP